MHAVADSRELRLVAVLHLVAATHLAVVAPVMLAAHQIAAHAVVDQLVLHPAAVLPHPVAVLPHPVAVLHLAAVPLLMAVVESH